MDDEDYYNADSDVSVESDNSDSEDEGGENERPDEYVGSIQPYMFEPMLTPEEAQAREAKQNEIQKRHDGRHAGEVSTWYVVCFNHILMVLYCNITRSCFYWIMTSLCCRFVLFRLMVQHKHNSTLLSAYYNGKCAYCINISH